MSHIVVDARLIKSTTGRYVEQLLRQLEKLDTSNRYTVLVREKEKDYYKPTSPNFSVVVAEFRHYSFAEQLGFYWFLRKLNADLTFFHMPQQPLLYWRPAITMVHDLILVHYKGKDPDMGLVERYIKRAIFSGLLLIVAWRAKHLMTPTQYTKDDLVKFSHINPNKVTVTYEGITRFGKPREVPQFAGKDFLVYLGQPGTHKNNRGLISAHQQLLKKHPELHLVLVGPINEIREADIAWVKAAGYKQVHFTGWLPDEQAAWLYKHARAFVWPTFREGIGLPPLEAMSQGCPVVSTNATCSPEVNGNAAHYFNPYSTEDMARAIDEVITNEQLRKQLITNGYKQIKRYDWHTMAKHTLAVFSQVLTRTR